MYDRNDVATAVRSIVQNISADVLSDAYLDTYILQGKRRLDDDKPCEVAGVVAGAGTYWINLSTQFSDWVIGFSMIKGVLNPAPDYTSSEGLTRISPSGYDLISDSGQDRLNIKDGIPSGTSALITYTVPWAVRDIDEADTTTLLPRYYNALEFISTFYTLLSLAAKSAGLSDNNIPTDFMNFRTKEAEYRRVAAEYQKSYLEVLGLLPNGKEPAIIVRGNYPVRESRNRITHI